MCDVSGNRILIVLMMCIHIPVMINVAVFPQAVLAIRGSDSVKPLQPVCTDVLSRCSACRGRQESTWAHGFWVQEQFRIQDQLDLTGTIPVNSAAYFARTGWLLLRETERTRTDSDVQFPASNRKLKFRLVKVSIVSGKLQKGTH